MKIGIDARLYRSSVAGIGRYSQNLIKNILLLDKKNQYVLIMTPEDAKEYRAKSSSQDNVEILETTIPHYSLSEQTKLTKILNDQKFDFVHFLNFNHPVSYKGRFIVTIHDLTLFFYPGRSKKGFITKIAYKYIMKHACATAKKIIAVSTATKKDILETFHVEKDKIQVVYEAADDKVFQNTTPDFLDKTKRKYGLDSTPIILYVGQWRPHKNLVGLIKAFEILRKKTEAKLVIVGKVDPSFPEVTEAIDKSAFLRDIIKPGFISEEELAAFYKLAKVFVFPSFYEGFGLPGLEAMMAQTPVCSSNRTSLPEVYQDAAVYFDPTNLEDMAKKIELVLKDDKLRKDLIYKGKELLNQYSWQKTAEETLSVYNKL